MQLVEAKEVGYMAEQILQKKSHNWFWGVCYV